jgi:hypothetical protein
MLLKLRSDQTNSVSVDLHQQRLRGLPIAAAQGTHDVEHRTDGTSADTHGLMARLS